MTVRCDNCLDEVEIEPGSIQTVTLDDLEIQYFSCPSCGKKYVILASNDEMKRLIAERRKLTEKIRIAHAKKFRKDTIQNLVRQQSAIIKKQKRLFDDLKARASELLQNTQQLTGKEENHGVL